MVSRHDTCIGMFISSLDTSGTLKDVRKPTSTSTIISVTEVLEWDLETK